MNTSAISKSQMKTFLQGQPAWKRGIANMAKVEQTDHYLSHITVAQDMAIGLLPKVVLSRSLAEMGESTFLEVLENVVVYYSIPFLGSKFLKPIFKKIAPHLDTDLLHKSLKDIPPHLKAQALPAKAALILGALGLAIAAEFGISYAKPLLTAHFTGKTDFSDVVGLKKGHVHQPDKEKNERFIQAMHRRLEYSIVALFGILGASLALAKFGHRVPALQKPLEKFVKHLDFEHRPNGSIALGLNQMGYYMGGAAVAYMNSCRDKLERVEVAARLAIVMPYLFMFRQLMSSKVNQHLAGKTPDAFRKKDGQLSPKTLNEIYKEGLTQAQKQYPKLSEQALQPHIRNITQQALNARLKAFAIPLATGIFGAGMSVTMMNRFWTKYRYRHQQHIPATKPDLPAARTAPHGQPAQKALV